jgi:predicted nucleic acid-binding protein
MLYIDTNVAIGLMHGSFEIEKLISKVRVNESLAITSISMYEIYSGLFIMQYQKKFKKGKDFIDKESESIEKLKNTLIQVEFTTKAARKSAELYFSLAGAGERLELFDCMIAGTILSCGDKDILTSNADHFNRIKDLNVIPL